MIRALIADDHNLVRQGIRALLEKSDDIQVVGEAEDGQQALDLAKQLKPDVIVMDHSMPRLNGTQAAEQIRAERLPCQVIMLSMYSDETLVRQALRSGVKGYLLKWSVVEELLLAIRAACRGETFISSQLSGVFLADVLAQKSDPDKRSPYGRLSAREIQVLKLIAEGCTNNAIAQAMEISVKTVEKHRKSLMAKLDVHDTAALVRLALKHGLVFLDE